MRYWDTSALVSLIIEERDSPACRRLVRTDSSIATWALTRTELVSAVRRREREGDLDRTRTRSVLARIERLAEHWAEIEDVVAVRERAERVLGRHPLGAADALQLGAALTLAEDRPNSLEFVVRDERLARAAEREGFAVVEPPA